MPYSSPVFHVINMVHPNNDSLILSKTSFSRGLNKSLRATLTDSHVKQCNYSKKYNSKVIFRDTVLPK